MLTTTLLALLGMALAPALAETIHGVAIVTRHGDRQFEYSISNQTCVFLADSIHRNYQAL
jgi:hypothetical protein